MASLTLIFISAFQNLYSWFSLNSLLGGVLEVADKWGNIVLIIGGLINAGHVLGKITHHVFKGFVLLGADLRDDLGDHVLQLLGLTIAGNDQEVLAHGKLNHGLAEVKNGGVVFEHVDLVNVIEGLDTEFLEGGSQLLVDGDLVVVGVGFLGSSFGTLATELGLSTESLCEFGTCFCY